MGQAQQGQQAPAAPTQDPNMEMEMQMQEQGQGQMQEEEEPMPEGEMEDDMQMMQDFPQDEGQELPLMGLEQAAGQEETNYTDDLGL